MSLLRRLNAAGIALFEQYLAVLRGGDTADPPTGALASPDYSEPLDAQIEIDDRDFDSRLEWAKYIDEKLEGKGLKNVERDVGLWAWLALFHVKRLLPSKKNGRKKLGEAAMWVPQINDYRRYYRHLLAGPYRIYRAHRTEPNSALILLGGPFGSHGEVVEQFASRLEIVTNRGLIESLTMLYWDANGGRLRRGAGGKDAGSARRLADVLRQFDLTWDLYSLSSPSFLGLLPKEFDRFRPESAPVAASA
ncbi:hypothetical protein AYO40_02620 [Planctomycetaceae bacterium SCGC AG-212-D15]|nr:hypothetical protein AYO40_02620 [Planctomycetaceae bacterium SCGC AG-212-D15]